MKTDPLLGPTEIRELAARLGIQPAKRLGQKFVVDAGTVTGGSRRWPGSARRTVVLEIGPGFGSLTLPLLNSRGPGAGDEDRPGTRGADCR